ncbi:MAG: SDR family oxidoreductase [Acidimicrobiia bacterium]
MATRTYAVTGSASGIGAATRTLLISQGHEVIGVDRRDAEVTVDLATVEGRDTMVAAIDDMTSGRLDGVVACAGLSQRLAKPSSILRVNYFGALATLHGLRPLLAAGDRPRAVVVASTDLLRAEPASALVETLLDGDEELAVSMVSEDDLGARAYRASKRAIARWVRRVAPSPDWAGAGIALNAIAPGLIDTPMTADLLRERRAEFEAAAPMPLCGVGAPADFIASALCWLIGPDNGAITGQVIFADGGGETLRRGDDIWAALPGS